MFSNTQDSNELKTQSGHIGTAELLEMKKREDDLFPALCAQDLGDRNSSTLNNV